MKDKIINKLEKWLSDKAPKKYRYVDNISVKTSHEDGYAFPTAGIQQNKEEIHEFINYVIENIEEKKKCLEIGLGHFGSTHFIFRELFDEVITIEKDFSRVRLFVDNLIKYDENYNLNNSRFVHGYSYEPSTIHKVEQILGDNLLDMLFIDGNHSYQDILTDYLIYKNFLKPGGYLVVHDYMWPFNDYEIKRFIDSLKGKYDIHKIIHSKEQGIVVLRRKK
mgnify:FL=1|jgi:cephalosporin hydroxylase|tara:strand:- start:313 stop:975 length:663 start_codon:yes stop_codon:yes gene_type:complete